jgi:hypothetical protein
MVSLLISFVISHTLTHEGRDHSMEGATFVPKAFLTSAQGSEVFSSFRGNISAKLKLRQVEKI